MRIIISIIAFIICGLSQAYAGISVDPSASLFDSRRLGMGGASVAFSNDGNSIFSNPAGLSGIIYPQISATSRKIFLDETQYSLFGISIPTNWGVVGFGYIQMGTLGSIPTFRDPASGRIIQDSSREAIGYSNSVAAISYAKDVNLPFNIPNKKIQAGANLNLYSQGFTGGSVDQGTGYSLDFGMKYKLSNWITTGAMLQKIIGGTIKWSKSEDRLSGFYKFGSSFNILGNSTEAFRASAQNLVLGIDISLPSNYLAQQSSMLYNFGAEYYPIKNIVLRTGLNQETGGTGLTFGVGFINSGFRFDYAYVDRQGIPQDNPHYFSISFIGERLVSVTKTLKRKETKLFLSRPMNRLITTSESVEVWGEAYANKVFTEKTTYTVPSFSQTSTTKEVYETEKLAQATLNGKLINNGTFETAATLAIGRNVIRLIGYTSPEAQKFTAEAVVLRYAPFADIQDTHWAVEPIALTSTLGLIKGYPDNTFKPEKGITRAELTTLLVRTLNISDEAWTEAIKTQRFKDIPPTHWAAPYINVGAQLGFVQGYPDGTFNGNKVINRVEGITVMARFAKLPEKDESAFQDLAAKFWGNKFIASAKDAGLLKYLEGKTFEATREYSRAEASEVLYRTKPIQQMVNDFWNFGAMPIPGTVPEYMLKKSEVSTPEVSTP
ncbi:S-layer homology domain-containing protein [Candidatus Saganbacteria bacterium]|nr:S-layer homology domain-containing protein [Candidatus Saganbacteria bacterium]